MTTIPCAAPHCGKELSVLGDWLQLDVPDKRFLWFCDLRCLHVWANHHAATGFREVQTKGGAG